jgi:hypothetical protein
LHSATQSFEGIQAQDHVRVLHEEWPSLVANQESIRDATWEIQGELSSLKRSAGADIDTLEVKTSQTRDVLGERPEVFGAPTVWATLARRVWNPTFLVCNLTFLVEETASPRWRRISRPWPRRGRKRRTRRTEGSERPAFEWTATRGHQEQLSDGDAVHYRRESAPRRLAGTSFTTTGEPHRAAKWNFRSWTRSSTDAETAAIRV